jgi:hypothetical protein
MLTSAHSTFTRRFPPLPAALLAVAAACLLASTARARDAGDPIRMLYDEGDLAGYSTIFAPDTQ